MVVARFPPLAGAPPVPERKGRAGEQPRERLLRGGVDALSDAELLAVCLRTGGGGYSALGLADHLLTVTGGLAGLAQTPAARLLQLPGLGPVKVAALLGAYALAPRAGGAGFEAGMPLSDARAAGRYVQGRIGALSREVFGCVFLDARNRPLGFEILFSGSIDRTHVHPREVLKRALTYNAAAVLLAHNHPSGVAEPSASDQRLTEQLQALLAQIDVRVLDHLIVTAGTVVSMAERGLLAG